MNHYEFNHYGSGDQNIHISDRPASTGVTGGIVAVFGLGCGAVLAAQMLAAAAAFLAANAFAIGGAVTVGAAGTVAVAYRRKIAALLPARPVTALPEPVQTVAALPAPAPAIQISPTAQQRIAVLRNTGYTLSTEDEAAVERLVQVEARKQKEAAWA